MNGSTINIADFRCRAITRATSITDRVQRGPHGFEIAEHERDREADLIHVAILQEDPTVYDIGIAREAQRLRHRAVFRPINIQRKAKVLRFQNELPVPLKRAESWAGRPDGPHDPPPAA